MLSLVGGTVGFFAALWTKNLIRSFVPFGGGPDATEVGLDPRVLFFTLAVTIVSGVLFGFAPALQASKPDLVPTLKGDITQPVGQRGFRLNLRKSLVVLQVSLSLLSLITAGLFVRSLQKAKEVNPGFITDKVVVFGFNLGREGYTPDQGKQFHRQALERVMSLPGVESATIARDRPFAGGFQRSVFIEGQEPPPGGRGVLVQVNNIGSKFFETLGIPLLRGRDFAETDNEKAPKVVIINEAMANRFWPDQDAIGKRFKFFGDQDFREVVAVSRDSKINSLTEQRRPFVYTPMLQEYSPQMTLEVRTSSDPHRHDRGNQKQDSRT